MQTLCATGHFDNDLGDEMGYLFNGHLEFADESPSRDDYSPQQNGYKRQRLSFDLEIKNQMSMAPNDENDLIPIREGCCGYSLYDRIEENPNRRIKKQYLKEIDRINRNLNSREE